MTEKEKKALERLKNTDVYNLGHDDRFEELRLYENAIDTALEELDKKDKVIEEIKSKLQKHINFCEQESRGHLENKVCHISLKFEKNLLEEVEKVGGEDE